MARFTDNWGLKLLSLGLALLLELYFYSPDNSVTETFPATIQIRNIPPAIMIIDPPYGEKGIPAQVELRGPRPLVDQAKAVVAKIWVDCPPSTMPGEFELSNLVEKTKAQLSLPSGVEVLAVIPTATRIVSEQIIGKTLPVKVNIVGEPEAGFKLESVKVSPDAVIVNGPKGLIETLDSIETEPVDVVGLNTSVKKEIPLKPQQALINLAVTLVNLEMKVTAIQATKTFKGIKVNVLAPQGHAATAVNNNGNVTVVLSGPSKVIDGLSEDSISLAADARDLGKGHYQVKLKGEFPPGVIADSITPSAIEIDVSGSNGKN